MNDPISCWLRRQRFYRRLSTYNISEHDFHELAAYNSDRGRGILFSTDTDVRMAELQDRYNTYLRNRP